MMVCARITAIALAALAALGWSARAASAASPWTDDDRTDRLTPVAVFGEVGRLDLGEPLAVAVDFDGNAVVADGSPGRLVMFDRTGERSQEFEQPQGNPGFFPTDITLYGFFTYAVDERQRNLVRFDKDGAYRDVLLNFDQLTGSRILVGNESIDIQKFILQFDTSAVGIADRRDQAVREQNTKHRIESLTQAAIPGSPESIEILWMVDGT